MRNCHCHDDCNDKDDDSDEADYSMAGVAIFVVFVLLAMGLNWLAPQDGDPPMPPYETSIPASAQLPHVYDRLSGTLCIGTACPQSPTTTVCYLYNNACPGPLK
jgi:hypothetical protein